MSLSAVRSNTRPDMQATWVPHPWLRALSPQRLRNFLEKGPVLDLVTDETLAAKGDVMDVPTIANVMEQVEAAQGTSKHAAATMGIEGDRNVWKGGGPPPDRKAKEGLPIAWSVSAPVHMLVTR